MRMTVNGSLDAVQDGRCYGWAATKGNAAPVSVEIAVDGVTVASGEAAIFRQDLLDAGIGSGLHGFAIELPGSVRDGRYHSVAVISAGVPIAEREQVQIVPQLTTKEVDKDAPRVDVKKRKTSRIFPRISRDTTKGRR